MPCGHDPVMTASCVTVNVVKKASGKNTTSRDEDEWMGKYNRFCDSLSTVHWYVVHTVVETMSFSVLEVIERYSWQRSNLGDNSNIRVQ